MSHTHHHSGIGTSARNRIRRITGSQVQRLLSKLDIIGPHLRISSLPLQELTSESDLSPGEVCKDSKGGGGGGKHVLQESSIINHLRRIGAVSNEGGRVTGSVTAIELGAGTGRLSERLQRVTNSAFNHVMVDRQDFTPSQCRDGAMKHRAKQKAKSQAGNDAEIPSIRRIVGDIAFFDIDTSCCHDDADAGVHEGFCFFLSKHLCGPACDLAIGSLERISSAGGRCRPPFAFATCCHYLCTYESFAGKEYWERIGLNEEDFEVAVAASQWYSLKRNGTSSGGGSGITNDRAWQSKDTCSHAKDECSERPVPDFLSRIDNAAAALRAHTMPPPSMPSEEFERTFGREDKARLGGNIKRVLDIARAAKLQELGYGAELVVYTTQSIENRLLVGRFREEKQ
eukprot:CAMPEP_0197459798 /NCGR_PEP_ID=MMETSP1175-20131217/52417_1 /TAXON_ID=1003142 /ORGANISM="Triceratium dubium, Strain CCMP147" /LENGTH=398 /DNA_ID=CAMNT_0042994767 /DNA_START=1 /DNA_END=1197 /DNA_ORIENTATION=+